MKERRCSMCGKVFKRSSSYYYSLRSICEECVDNCLKNKDQFISEYKELCRKYHLCIDGCECYGGPFISVVEDDDSLNNHIKRLRREEVF